MLHMPFKHQSTIFCSALEFSGFIFKRKFLLIISKNIRYYLGAIDFDFNVCITEKKCSRKDNYMIIFIVIKILSGNKLVSVWFYDVVADANIPYEFSMKSIFPNDPAKGNLAIKCQ